MEKRSFLEVVNEVNGDSVEKYDLKNDNDKTLLFPKNYHDSFLVSDPLKPFLKKGIQKSGKPALIISEDETTQLTEKMIFTLVGKFSPRRANLDLIPRHLAKLKLSGRWNAGVLDSRNIMFQLTNEEDYTYLFSLKLISIDNCHMKILKWTLEFDCCVEPSIAPVWLCFPGLKLHLYNKQILFCLAALYGKPLKLDWSTFNLTRPSVARILVELDVSTHFSKKVWIGTNSEGYWQKVEFERMSFYCSHCMILGHSLERCFKANPSLKADNQKLEKIKNDKESTNNKQILKFVDEVPLSRKVQTKIPVNHAL